jgi:hypothetical protein
MIHIKISMYLGISVEGHPKVIFKKVLRLSYDEIKHLDTFAQPWHHLWTTIICSSYSQSGCILLNVWTYNFFMIICWPIMLSPFQIWLILSSIYTITVNHLSFSSCSCWTLSSKFRSLCQIVNHYLIPFTWQVILLSKYISSIGMSLHQFSTWPEIQFWVFFLLMYAKKIIGSRF